MIYGEKNVGAANTVQGPHAFGFYPHKMGETQILDTNVSVGVYPDGWNSSNQAEATPAVDAMEGDSSSSYKHLQVLSAQLPSDNSCPNAFSV